MRARVVTALAMCAALLLAAGALALGKGKPPHNHGKAKAENRALFAVLEGKNEISTTTERRGAGDPDGRGSFTATIDGDQLCFGITVKNLDAPTMAHIHKGRRNVNGPIVVPLVPAGGMFAPGGDPGAASGCVPIDADLAAAILKNPHKYYANVHTGPFPNGAARGQLFRKSH